MSAEAAKKGDDGVDALRDEIQALRAALTSHNLPLPEITANPTCLELQLPNAQLTRLQRLPCSIERPKATHCGPTASFTTTSSMSSAVPTAAGKSQTKASVPAARSSTRWIKTRPSSSPLPVTGPTMFFKCCNSILRPRKTLHLSETRKKARKLLTSPSESASFSKSSEYPKNPLKSGGSRHPCLPPFYEGLTPPLLDSEVRQVCLGWHIHAVETPDDFDDMMDALLDQVLGLMEPVPSVIPETELAGTRWATTRTVRGWLTRRRTGQELQHAVTWQPLKQADILDKEEDSVSITETASSDEEASAIETSHVSDGDSGGDSSGASSTSGCDLNSSITSCVCTPSAEPAKEQAKYLMDLPTEVLQLIASVRLREQ
jgi:hypothetical protein